MHFILKRVQTICPRITAWHFFFCSLFGRPYRIVDYLLLADLMWEKNIIPDWKFTINYDKRTGNPALQYKHEPVPSSCNAEQERTEIWRSVNWIWLPATNSVPFYHLAHLHLTWTLAKAAVNKQHLLRQTGSAQLMWSATNSQSCSLVGLASSN